MTLLKMSREVVDAANSVVDLLLLDDVNDNVDAEVECGARSR